MQESSEEAGLSNPSNSNKPNNSTSANPTFPSHPHPTRIHFPNPNINTQPHINAQPSNTNSRANVKTSLNLNNAIAGSSKDTSTSARRRVVSVDAGNPYGSLRGTRSGLGATSGMGRRMPTMSMGATGTSGRRVASLESTDSKESQPDSSSADSGWGMGTFSDEYDLSHEGRSKNPTRRSATSPTPVLTTTTDVTQPSSTSAPLAPSSTTPSAPTASAISTLTAPSTADIDFSPSTGPSVVRVRVDPLRRLHPIPLSNDGGETLDWSGSGSVNGYASEDEKSEKAEKSEKRWSLSVSRRGKEKEKEKEKERELLPSAEDLKRLEGLYVAKLSRIKSSSSQSTSKKVAITADQIGRRYNLIYTSLLTPGSTLLPNHQSDITTTSASETDIKEFNLLKVSKWYSAQDPLVRSSLEKAEPFIWLKHLEKKRNIKQPKGEEGHKDKAGGEEDNVKEDPTAATTTNTTTRLPWHLSALIMEEYILAQSAKNHSHFPAFPVRNIPHLQPPLKPINPTPYAARSMRSIPEHPSSPDSATHTHDFGKDYVPGTNMPSPPDDGGGGGTGSLNDLLPPFIPSGYSTPSGYSAYSPPSIYSNYSPPSTYSTHSAPAQSQQSRSAPYTPRTPYTPYSPYTLLNNNNNSSTSPPSPQHGRISFEPLLDPPSFINRPSNESRRSLESTFSSIFSSGGGVGNTNTNTPAPGGAVFSSPASSRSRLHIRDSFGLRKPRSTSSAAAAAAVNANESDDGNGYGSSARNSATEQSDNGGGDRGEESFIHVESEEPETATPGASTAPAPGGLSPTGKGGSGVVGPGSSGAVNVVGATVSPNAVGSNLNSNTALRANTNTRNLRPLRPLRNRNRNSLPTTEEDRITLAIERKRKQEAEEAREDMEYELKAQLVASCKDSNAHIRLVSSQEKVRKAPEAVVMVVTVVTVPEQEEEEEEGWTRYLAGTLFEAFKPMTRNVTLRRETQTYRAVYE
ncbi:hypothetical protein LENED_009057 [Lentinula edodes]|uniref:Uncharacterized protein n=1 Tax=Lentinula edodes TaxID=5353 RepID=A0A1Q3EIR8_LENED|nr:hypothetical protein LENED_009057 [Lentinula edodes]